MNINLRALVFGTTVAAAAFATCAVTMNVVAAESVDVVRLDPVNVVAHRAAADVEIIRLDPVVVTAHKSVK